MVRREPSLSKKKKLVGSQKEKKKREEKGKEKKVGKGKGKPCLFFFVHIVGLTLISKVVHPL